MFKHHKRLLTYLLALGITLAQCSMVFAEFTHPFHAPDGKCSVCVLSDHLSHAMVHIPPALYVDQFSVPPSTETVVILTTSFNFRYFIRAPPSL